MRSAAMPRFSSKIPGFISYVILRHGWRSPSRIAGSAYLRQHATHQWGFGESRRFPICSECSLEVAESRFFAESVCFCISLIAKMMGHAPLVNCECDCDH